MYLYNKPARFHLHICSTELRAPLFTSQRATEEELDLDNPAVIGFLVKMQESHQAGLEAKRGDGKEGDWDKSNKTEREKCQPGEDDDQVRAPGVTPFVRWCFSAYLPRPGGPPRGGRICFLYHTMAGGLIS